MLWTTIATIDLTQNWQLTPEIPLDLGYVRFVFPESIGAVIRVGQIDLSSPSDVYDERRIVASANNQVYEFKAPSVFSDRALALRVPNFAQSFEVRIEVSTVPLPQSSAAGNNDNSAVLSAIAQSQTQIIQQLNTIDIEPDPAIAAGVQSLTTSQTEQSTALQQLGMQQGQILQQLQQPLQIPTDPAVVNALNQLQTQQSQLFRFLSRAQFNGLVYNPINNADYTYHTSSYQMPTLIDGQLNVGMMANAARVFVHIQLASAVYLNRIQIYAGQFNGAFNVPRTFRVYAGHITAETTAPLYEAQVAVTTAMQSFDTFQSAGLDVPRSAYTLVFFNSSHSSISVSELQLFGQLA